MFLFGAFVVPLNPGGVLDFQIFPTGSKNIVKSLTPKLQKIQGINIFFLVLGFNPFDGKNKHVWNHNLDFLVFFL